MRTPGGHGGVPPGVLLTAHPDGGDGARHVIMPFADVPNGHSQTHGTTSGAASTSALRGPGTTQSGTRTERRVYPALAMITAMYGRKTAPAAKTHRIHPSTTTTRIRQTVRMAMEIR